MAHFSKQENSVYVAGSVARLTGSYLSFDADDVEQDGTAVRIVAYLETGKKRIGFGVPVGMTGTQSVEVRTRRRAEGALLAAEPSIRPDHPAYSPPNKALIPAQLL